MLRRKLYWLIVSFGLITLLVNGCANQDTDKYIEITFDQLFSSPSQYEGKNVSIEGFVFLGFEIIVVSEGLEYSGYATGHLIPSDRKLWIEGGIPTDIYNDLYEQNMIGPSERYGKILIKGTFEYGGHFGHLGSYEYQISPLEIQLLTWTPI